MGDRDEAVRYFWEDVLFAQLKLAYDNPESMEIAARKLNVMKQGGKSFSSFISGFEKTMLETGGLQWDEQVKKTFLNTAITTDLQEALVATRFRLPTLVIENLLHGVNNNLESLRTKKIEMLVYIQPIKVQGMLRGIR